VFLTNHGTDGKDFLKGLHAAGIVLYYSHRAPDWIYLKPRAITRELLHMLDPDGTLSTALMKNKTADLEKLEAEYVFVFCFQLVLF
jgi:hypothetical protein